MLFSGNWVKCLIKCCHSLYFLLSGIMYCNWLDVSVRNTVHSVLVVPEGRRRHPFTSLPWFLWCLSSPLQTPCLRLPQPRCPGLKCLLSLLSVSSSGATYTTKPSSAFNQNHDANKCRQPRNLATSFCSWSNKPRDVNWPCWDWVSWRRCVLKLRCLLNSCGIC